MTKDKEYDEQPGAPNEQALLRALAYLCRRLEGFKEQAAADRIESLQSLGLPIAAAQSVEKLFEQMFEFPDAVFDPGIERCPIPWRPSVLTPVFHGYVDIDLVPLRDQVIAPGATAAPGPGILEQPPGPVRVFYPSLSGTKANAPILRGCGRYPLVVFVHGQCLGATPDVDLEHFKSWYHLPQQLARSGYVVLVPQLGRTNPFDDVHLSLVRDLVRGLRQSWQQRDQLALSIGIIGHSNGALLGARLAAELRPSVFIGLSGNWVDSIRFVPNPLSTFNGPVMLMRGTGVDGDASLSGGLFELITEHKHIVEFKGGNHFDYLPVHLRERCARSEGGPCDLVRLLAADFAAMFLARYMPPPSAVLPHIPVTLQPPPVDLTNEQNFYAGSMLTGLSVIGASKQCSVTHSWFLKNGTEGSITLGTA